jgi:capsule polysaccharide export protein KpsE/RkpR
MRVKKDDCKLKFKKILDEGEYTIDELVAALEYEVLQKKENSVKAGENKLKYMQNSLTYLNQRTFEPYIELIKEGNIVPTEEHGAPSGSVDI